MTVLTLCQTRRIARLTGWSLLMMIILSIIASMTVSKGLDVNLSADIFGTSDAMKDAPLRLRGHGYLSLYMFMVEMLVAAGLFLMLRRHGPLWAWWSLLVSIGASALGLMGAMFAMNVAGMLGDPQFAQSAGQSGAQALAASQVLSDYTSFHLALIGGSAANIGFFYLFWSSGLIPKLIAGWGVFASGLVMAIITARDFIPELGANAITMAFMLCNLIAIISLALYLIIKGVRDIDPTHNP